MKYRWINKYEDIRSLFQTNEDNWKFQRDVYTTLIQNLNPRRTHPPPPPPIIQFNETRWFNTPVGAKDEYQINIIERSESQSFSPHEFSCNDETMENNDTRKSILPTIVALFVEQKLEHRSLFLNLALQFPLPRSSSSVSTPKGTIVISAPRDHFLPFTWPIKREKSSCLSVTVSPLGTFYASSFPAERINVALPTPRLSNES